MGGSIFLHAPFGGQEGVEEERGALGPQECVVVAPTSTGVHAEMLTMAHGPPPSPVTHRPTLSSKITLTPLSMAPAAHCPPYTVPVGPTHP